MDPPKRKQEFSTNPHSVKRQKRTAALSPAALERERAVKSEASFRGYHTRQFKQTAGYLQAADDPTRATMLKNHIVAQLAVRYVPRIGRLSMSSNKHTDRSTELRRPILEHRRTNPPFPETRRLPVPLPFQRNRLAIGKTRNGPTTHRLRRCW